MRTIGAYEAKTHLPRLLEDVARGETIVITKRGVPVAHLIPASATRQHAVEEAIADLRSFRQGRSLGDISVEELISEGRRY